MAVANMAVAQTKNQVQHVPVVMITFYVLKQMYRTMIAPEPGL